MGEISRSGGSVRQGRDQLLPDEALLSALDPACQEIICAQQAQERALVRELRRERLKQIEEERELERAAAEYKGPLEDQPLDVGLDPHYK
jgi:hypothetical protein